MSLKDNLQDAKFRGVTFDCQRIRDGVERATAEYGYPYVDGDDVADLGRRSRKVNMSAIFFGDDYESRLQTFLSVLDTAGSAELIHPVFGSMPVGHEALGHVGDAQVFDGHVSPSFRR